MNLDDLPAAEALRAAAGWNQTSRDWQRLLAYEPQGCFVALCDRTVVGTVTTTRYGTRAAWVGMVLVQEEYRGRGIGSALMRSALTYLRQVEIDCIMLDATPHGRSVYERLGFREQWSSNRWTREPHIGWEGDLEIELPDQPRFSMSSSLATLDRVAFGADRTDWLEGLAADSLVISDAEGGFAMRRAGATASYLGPVIAASATAARPLIDALLRDVSGPVIWDIPEPNAPARSMAKALGFQPARSLTRMAIGALRPPPDPLLQFAFADLATG
jgi:GNAT superfamily N-acetyltransferase